jgi:predicted DsbA family dithiol-disulfide isomerase
MQVADIEVFADVWCPFAYVGLRAVETRRAVAHRPDVALRVRAWPLELVNGRPQDALTTDAHVRALREQVAPQLFAGFDPNRFPTTTLPALALTATAYRLGDSIGEAVGLALRTALFEGGADISDAAELASIAGEFELPDPTAEDTDRVLADLREGQARGVVGSPHFFSGHTDLFCPYLDITKDPGGRTQIQLNAARLDSFLAACFSSPGSGAAAPREDP